MDLVWWGTLFQKYFSFRLFVAVCLLKTEIKQDLTAKMCFVIIIMTVCILSVSLNFFSWSRVKNKTQHRNIELQYL